MADAVIESFPLDFHWPTMDPFLFCAHHHDRFPAGNGAMGPAASLSGRQIGQDFAYQNGWNMYHGERVPGFPVHPHRGFETVTIVREGLVDHADSLNAAGRYGNGDVQWLTTGSGVQHSEMFPLVDENNPNPLLLFQVWLNLPAHSKMVPAHFSMFWAKDIPVYEEDGVRVEVIAGHFGNLHAPAPPPDSWAADPANAVCILHVSLQPGANLTLQEAGEGIGRILYFHDGESIHVDSAEYSAGTGLQLDSTQAVTVENGDAGSEFLLLQGRPIGEPVAQHGPFVMNTREELQQAFRDYQETGFGGWAWPQRDPVHTGKGRFARHADGTEESP